MSNEFEIDGAFQRATRRLLRRDFGWNVPALVVGRVAALLAIVAVTRLVGIPLYGTWVQVQVIAQLFSLPIGLGAYQAVVVFVPAAQLDAEGRNVIGSAVAIVLSLGLPVACGVIWLGPLFARLSGSAGEKNAFRLCGALAAANALVFLLRSAFRALDDLRMFAAMSVVADGVELATITVGGMVTRSLTGIVGFGVVGSFAVALLMFVVLNRRVGALVPRRRWIAPLARYGAPLVVTQLSDDVLARGDRILVGRFLGPNATALYSAVYAIVSLPNLLTRALTDVIFPKMVGTGPKAGLGQEARRLIVLMGVVSATLLLTLAVFGTSIIDTLLGRVPYALSRTDFAALVILTGCGTFAFGLARVAALPIFAARRTALLAAIWVAGGLLNIGANAVLLPSMGIVGAGVSNAVAYSIFLVAILRMRSRSDMTIRTWGAPA